MREVGGNTKIYIKILKLQKFGNQIHTETGGQIYSMKEKKTA